MRVRIVSQLPSRGISQRYLADGGGRFEIQAVPAGPEAEEMVSRLIDGGRFCQRYRKVVGNLPEVIGSVRTDAASGIVRVATDHVALDEVGELPPIAALWLLAGASRHLAQVADLRDVATGMLLHPTYRSFSGSDLRVSPRGDLMVDALEALWTSASDREARTRVAAFRPGARVAPEQEGGDDDPRTALWLLCHTIVRRLCPGRVKDGRPLGYTCNTTRDTDEAWRELLEELRYDPPFCALLARGLRWTAHDRPPASEFAARAEALLASARMPGALDAWFATIPPPLGGDLAGMLDGEILEVLPLLVEPAPVLQRPSPRPVGGLAPADARLAYQARREAAPSSVPVRGPSAVAAPRPPGGDRGLAAATDALGTRAVGIPQVDPSEAQTVRMCSREILAPPRVLAAPFAERAAQPATAVRAPAADGSLRTRFVDLRVLAVRVRAQVAEVASPFAQFDVSPGTRQVRAIERRARARDTALILTLIAAIALAASAAVVLLTFA